MSGVGQLCACCRIVLHGIKRHGFKEFPGGLTVKDLALSLQWQEFDPWPRNFQMAAGMAKKKKKKTWV